MKSYSQRKAEFAAKKADLDADHQAKQAQTRQEIRDGLDAAAAQHAEARSENAARYEERTSANRAEWESAKETFRERRAARKNR